MIAYLLYTEDADDGHRESWNVFYCIPEIFSSDSLRKQRIAERQIDDPELQFFETDIEIQ